jgi:hypothetical protein
MTLTSSTLRAVLRCVVLTLTLLTIAARAQITFTPSSTGARNAVLSLKDTAPGSPQLLPLAGTGQ